MAQRTEKELIAEFTKLCDKSSLQQRINYINKMGKHQYFDICQIATDPCYGIRIAFQTQYDNEIHYYIGMMAGIDFDIKIEGEKKDLILKNESYSYEIDQTTYDSLEAIFKNGTS